MIYTIGKTKSTLHKNKVLFLCKYTNCAKPLDFLSVQYYNIVSTESEVIRCRPVQADRPKTTLKILAYK